MICQNDGEEAKSISLTKRFIIIKVNLNVFSVVIKFYRGGGGANQKVFCWGYGYFLEPHNVLLKQSDVNFGLATQLLQL